MKKIAAFLAFAGLAIFVPQVSAQVYKWVDENGVTHYSDQAPAKGKAEKKAAVVPDRLSVYSTGPYLAPVSYSGGDPILNGRVEALERQLRAEREARESMAAAQAQASFAAYERCLADRRVDCDDYGGLYPQYAWPVAVSARARLRRPFAPHPSPLTGITAGNVVALAPKGAARSPRSPASAWMR